MIGQTPPLYRSLVQQNLETSNGRTLHLQQLVLDDAAGLDRLSSVREPILMGLGGVSQCS